jgi:hypothetical protein
LIDLAFGSAYFSEYTPTSISAPFIVPFTGFGPAHLVTLPSSPNYALTVLQPGTFAVDYFVKVHFIQNPPATLSGPPLTIQVLFSGAGSPTSVEDELIPVPIYGAFWTPPATSNWYTYNALSSGTRHIVRTLAANNTVQLLINAIPANMDKTVLDYFRPDNMVISAYVAIHQIG